ncbi:MAG: outer membrane protein assembly factor BamD [Candidatus Omnitrophica bacterium]|nr:outer membrane protein assembly factor BamD [Candidatus Omnitrophota bacterium]
MATCAYKSSLKPDYDIESTNQAIKAFEEFSQENSTNDLSKEASVTIQRLKDKSAEKSMSVAKFYESQKHYESAIIYYQDVVNRFSDSSLINTAKAKIEELKRKIKK